MIIVCNILGAAEGFLPRALMLDFPQAAKTQQGPNIQSANINKSARFLSILLLHYYSCLISIDRGYSAAYGKYLLIDDKPSAYKPAY